jgi:hypothetical protein
MNFKERNKLYKRTFLKHGFDSRVFTLQQEAINLSSKAGHLALDMSPENFNKFAETIAGIETTIEIIKISVPSLPGMIADIKYQKLQNLKDFTDKKEAKELTDKMKSKNGSPIIHKVLTKEETLKKAEIELKSANENEAINNFRKSLPKETKALKAFYKYCIKSYKELRLFFK